MWDTFTDMDTDTARLVMALVSYVSYSTCHNLSGSRSSRQLLIVPAALLHMSMYLSSFTWPRLSFLFAF